MQFRCQAACGECPAHPGASLLDGATCGLGDPRHHLPFPGLAPGLEWCGPVFWPHGGQGPALPTWEVPPAGLSCLWPAGQTPGAWSAGVRRRGRGAGPRAAVKVRRNRDCGCPVGFSGTRVSPGCTRPEGALSLSSRKRPELPRMPSAPRITTFPPAPVTCDAVRNKCREMLAAALRTDRERLRRAPGVLQ